ncbi:hypothetical protein LSAT2_029911 [Lamellibrachia satsuma]|nr:hypothetical protein LSAT2_029911 [Lamellibrachia satsuma]
MRNTSGNEPRVRTRTETTDSSLTSLLREHSGKQQQPATTRLRPTSAAGRRRGSDVFVEDAMAMTAAVAPISRHPRPKSACSSRLRRAKKSSTDSGCGDDDDDEDELIYVDEDYLRRSTRFDSTGIGGLSLAPTVWDEPTTDINDGGECDGRIKPGEKRTSLSTLNPEPRRRGFSDSAVVSGQHDIMGMGRTIAFDRVRERYRRRTSLDTTGNHNGITHAHNPHRPTSRTPENSHPLPRKLQPILVRTRQSSLGDDRIGRDEVKLNGRRDPAELSRARLVHPSADIATPLHDGSMRPANNSAALTTRNFGRSRAWKSLKPLDSRRPSNSLPQTP